MAGRSGLSKALIALVLLIAVLAVAGLITAWRVGAWNLLFPDTTHDVEPPTLPASLPAPAVLVFSKTNGFRHEDGIAGGLRALQRIARDRDWSLYHTENGAVFNPRDLARFNAVVFLNASGDMLSEPQEKAFQAWLEVGGGWLGIHAAGDGSHSDWRWYREKLIGADFTAHIMGPQFQTATVVLENHRHPVLAGIPNLWQHEEEWYSWAQSPRAEGFLILATLDETSYSPVQKLLGREQDLRMGDHPVVWANCVGQGRSVYVAMGHRGDAFEQPQLRKLLANSLDYLLAPPAAGCATEASLAAEAAE